MYALKGPPPRASQVRFSNIAPKAKTQPNPPRVQGDLREHPLFMAHFNKTFEPIVFITWSESPFSVFFSFIFKLIFVSNSFQNYMTCGVVLRFAGNFNVKFANKFKTFQTL